MVIIFVFISVHTYGGNVGLVLTQLTYLIVLMQLGLTQCTEIDNFMTSVQRVLEYTNVPQESDFESIPSKLLKYNNVI